MSRQDSGHDKDAPHSPFCISQNRKKDEMPVLSYVKLPTRYKRRDPVFRIDTFFKTFDISIKYDSFSTGDLCVPEGIGLCEIGHAIARIYLFKMYQAGRVIRSYGMNKNIQTA